MGSCPIGPTILRNIMRYHPQKETFFDTLRNRLVIISLKARIKFYPHAVLRYFIKHMNSIPRLQYNQITEADYRKENGIFIIEVYKTQAGNPIGVSNLVSEGNKIFDLLSDIVRFEAKI